MPETTDSSDKRSRTKGGVGSTEIEHETAGRSSDSDDDYQSRARQDTRDAGDRVRDAGRAVRRDATDLFSVGCDFLSGIFYGVGDVLSPRRRGSSRSGSSNQSGSGRGKQ